MATIRRNEVTIRITLALAIIGLGLIACAWDGRSEPTGLVLKTGTEPGSLSVENQSGTDIEVRRAMRIERKSGDSWVSATVDFQLISDCAQAQKSTRCARIPARGSINVVAWTGYSCSGQCNTPCRANVLLPSGSYRFVAILCRDGTPVYSEPFEWVAKK